MARRRRKRKHQEIEDDHDAPSLDTPNPNDAPPPADPDDEDDPHVPLAASDESPSGSFHARPDLSEDHSCLRHPSSTLEYQCTQCEQEMCSMCSISVQGVGRMCGDCFTLHVQRSHSVGGVGGWLGLVAGFLGVCAVATYVTAARDPRVLGAIPGGGASLGYAALVCAALGVVFGCWSQDGRGVHKRAGAVGIALGVLGLVGVLGLRVMATIG